MYLQHLLSSREKSKHLVYKSTKIIYVADIEDTEVIWIALLRHAGKNTGST